jgi:hypothetical protein
VLGPVDYVLWLAGFCAEVWILSRAVIRKEFLRYSCLNLYVLAVALTTAGHFLIYRRYGFLSLQYRYFYFYTETLLTVLLYFTIMHFYQDVFRGTSASQYVRGAALILLGATSVFSYIAAQRSAGNVPSRFLIELSQNLYFVGVVLTYLLWGALLKLRETRARLVQLVLAMGIYFSLDAAGYALFNLFPGLQVSVWKWIPPLAGVWLPLAWGYTFTKVPEDAEILTSQLLAGAR